MKLIRTMICFGLAVILAGPLCAKPKHVQRPMSVEIQLSSILAERTSERSGDEIYFAITQYSNQEFPREGRVPMQPNHWLSRNLRKIRNVPLWKVELKKGEAVQVILSLIEQDSPPWDLDDHIGSVKVTLVNRNGRLQTTWGQPNFVDQPKVVQKKGGSQFMLLGNQARYEVSFKVRTK